jgi:hypothetical protein
VTPDGRRVITSRCKGIRVWSLVTGSRVATIHVDRLVACVSATNEVLCAADFFGNLWTFELPPGGDDALREAPDERLAGGPQ